MAVGFVFLLTSLAWVPFAAYSLRAALDYFGSLHTFTMQIQSYVPVPDMLAATSLTFWPDWQVS